MYQILLTDRSLNASELLHIHKRSLNEPGLP